ncbi:MAG TPA: RNA polymerase sigma factor [Pyrinomonadaceae bacterium]|jgi:RNA polymerase sigma-70 factor (ECF subfamily)
MNERDADLTETRRVANGDAEAFSRLYNKYRDRVFGFAYRMLGSQSIAEEVTQEVFLALIENPERFHPERGSMPTFLCSVARNRILNYFRKRGGEIEDYLEDDELQTIEDESEPDPLAALLDRELGTKVREAIALLPALQREAVVLREFQELSYEEISIVVGAEINVVKARIYRARQTLGKRLAPYLVSNGEVCYELRKS